MKKESSRENSTANLKFCEQKEFLTSKLDYNTALKLLEEETESINPDSESSTPDEFKATIPRVNSKDDYGNEFYRSNSKYSDLSEQNKRKEQTRGESMEKKAQQNKKVKTKLSLRESNKQKNIIKKPLIFPLQENPSRSKLIQKEKKRVNPSKENLERKKDAKKQKNGFDYNFSLSASKFQPKKNYRLEMQENKTIQINPRKKLETCKDQSRIESPKNQIPIQKEDLSKFSPPSNRIKFDIENQRDYKNEKKSLISIFSNDDFHSNHILPEDPSFIQDTPSDQNNPLYYSPLEKSPIKSLKKDLPSPQKSNCDLLVHQSKFEIDNQLSPLSSPLPSSPPPPRVLSNHKKIESIEILSPPQKGKLKTIDSSKIKKNKLLDLSHIDSPQKNFPPKNLNNKTKTSNNNNQDKIEDDEDLFDYNHENNKNSNSNNNLNNISSSKRVSFSSPSSSPLPKYVFSSKSKPQAHDLSSTQHHKNNFPPNNPKNSKNYKKKPFQAKNKPNININPNSNNLNQNNSFGFNNNKKNKQKKTENQNKKEDVSAWESYLSNCVEKNHCQLVSNNSRSFPLIKPKKSSPSPTPQPPPSSSSFLNTKKNENFNDKNIFFQLNSSHQKVLLPSSSSSSSNKISSLVKTVVIDLLSEEEDPQDFLVPLNNKNF